MKRIVTIFSTFAVLLWSTQASAIFVQLTIDIFAGEAKSVASTTSSIAERFVIDEVRAQAKLYEQGILVHTDNCQDDRVPGQPAICTAIAVDQSLSQGCVYCNDLDPPTGQSYGQGLWDGDVIETESTILYGQWCEEWRDPSDRR